MSVWRIAAGSCLMLLASTVPSVAQQKGLPKLDEATDVQLNAESLGDMEKVVGLCEQALKEGLDDENQKFARQLASSTLLEMARRRMAELSDRERARRWQAIRDLALKDLERAAKFDDSNADIHLMRARMYAMPGGDREKALQSANRAVKLLADDRAELTAAYLLRAGLQSDAEARLADLNAAVEAEIDGNSALQARAMFHVGQGNADQAQADFQELVKREPDEPEHRFAFAMALVTLRKFPEALREFDTIAKANPELSAPHKMRAQVLRATGDLKAAANALDRALQIDQQDMESLLLRSEVFEELGDFDRARADVEQILQQQPGMPEAILQRASIFSAQKKYDLALADLGTLLKQNPKNTQLRVQIAQLYLAGGWPRKAADIASAVIKDEPGNWLAYRGRADAYLAIGKHAEAIADFESAARIAPDNSGILNNFAWVLATSPNEKLRNAPRSIEMAMKACQLTDFKESHILSTLAAGYAEAGDFDSAIKWSTKSVELSEGEARENLKQELESYQKKKPWREMQQTEERPNPPLLRGDLDL